MLKRPQYSLVITAAAATAAAAACAFLILWSPVYPGGWGVPIAKWGEVWGQRLLPGGWTAEFVEPSWKEEPSLAAYGHVRYDGRPHGAFHICLPYAVTSLGLGIVAMAAHVSLCWCVAHLRWLKQPTAPLAFRSTLRAAWVPLFLCILYWFWAGVARGSITQRVVGGTYVEIAFGPFGRTVVLLGGLLLYVSMVLWTARRTLRAATGEPCLSTGDRVAARNARWPAVAATILALVLLLFPYWSVQTLRLVGQGTAIKIGQWSETTPLRGVLEKVAPMP